MRRIGVEVPRGEWSLFSTVWGGKDGMFSFYSAKVVRKWHAVRVERCMRRDCVTTALCGVTDGDSERQTELSEREERKTYWFSMSPAPCHDSGTWAMPCPSTLSSSHQEEHRAFDLIWRLLDTSSCHVSGATSGEIPIKDGAKKSTASIPEIGGGVRGGQIYCAYSQQCAAENIMRTFET